MVSIVEPDRSRSGYRILLVVDNLVNQKVAMRLLEKKEHQVEVVANGREAVEQFQSEPFDLILMDIQMPEMGGFEATVAIREGSNARGRWIPIIAVTAHAMRGYRDQCLAVEMNGYVSKPIRPNVLYQEIERVMSSTRSLHQGFGPLGGQ